MGKHLKVIYGDAVLWDASVSSLEWHDSESGIKIDGRVRAKPASSSSSSSLGGGILDMLSKASKAKTAQVAGEKREHYEAKAEPGSASAAEPGSEPVEESVGE